MKRILILVLIVLLVSLAATTIINGFKIGDFEVLGFRNLQKSDMELESKVEQAKTLTSVTFPEKLSSLTSAEKELITTKEKYQDKVAYSSEEDVRKANEVEIYQVDFLFTRLGNHAKKYGLEIDLDAKQTQNGTYDLNFTVHGKYSLISDFVRAVENDKELTFTIESFDLLPDNGSVETLKATFTVTNLNLDVDDKIQNTSTIYTMEKNPNDTNNANNQNSNNNTNNTNNTNNDTNNSNKTNINVNTNTTNNTANNTTNNNVNNNNTSNQT